MIAPKCEVKESLLPAVSQRDATPSLWCLGSPCGHISTSFGKAGHVLLLTYTGWPFSKGKEKWFRTRKYI